MNFLFLIVILLPMLTGFSLLVRHIPDHRRLHHFVFWPCLANSILTAALLVIRPGALNIYDFGSGISLTFRCDSLSLVFAVILAVLWPITNLFAFEYMEHSSHQNRFFAFFTMTYGVVLGIAFAANTFTLYLFYELLTLCTLMLVMHEMDGEARYAAKKYLLYSMTGAAMAFLSMILLMNFGSLNFVLGGTLDATRTAGREELVLIGFVLGFFGFGVKAAIFPFHGWLPSAGVAPTPVTALLHAVAVVNAGIFAVLRLIYYSYGTSALQGTWAQQLVMGASIFTLVFGSTMAWRMPHLKRRLAYSTVSNLSYILFAACLMTPAGLTGALTHMAVHSVLKITLFFCAGSLLCQTHHRPYIWQYEGLGHRMPVTAAAFIISGIGLMGVPPLPGFVSKWLIAEAAVETANPLAWLGAFGLVVSAFLTGLYLIHVVIVFYCPPKGIVPAENDHVKEAGWQICLPLALLCVIMTLMGLFSDGMVAALHLCAGGLL